MKNAIFFIFLMFSQTFQAQEKSGPYWLNASLTLTDGTELSGIVNYNIRFQNISLQADGEVQVFTHNEIERVTFEKNGRSREFRLVEIRSEKDNKTELVLAELIHHGVKNYSLYKYYWASTQIETPDFSGSIIQHYPLEPDGRMDSFVFDQDNINRQNVSRFLVDHEGNVIKAGKRQFLKAHKDKRQELRSYINNQNLNVERDEDILKAMQYYDEIGGQIKNIR